MIRLNLAAAVLLAFASLFFPGTADAETYNTCTGFITSLPTVIATQGTWCFKQDLATAITSGNAIAINTNNVTIDCNNFKLGGLAAGTGTFTIGISALDHQNATVRHCNIRGFHYGIHLAGSASGGHVVEDNRFDGNTYGAIYVEGDGSLVQRNRVFDTGGATSGSQDTTPIWAVGSVDIIDNTVTNAFAGGTNITSYGIFSSGNLTGRIIGNGVRGVLGTGGGDYGIVASAGGRITLRNNDVVGDASTGSFGITCASAQARARDNVINGFAIALNFCGDAGGNDITP